MNLIEVAKKYSESGFSVIPVSISKIPTIKEWRKYQNKPMTSNECEKYFKDAHGIALICGGYHNLTAIDFDLKNDITGDLFERFKERVPRNILEKMYVQKTQNQGYHFVFKCKTVEPSQKLANRLTTVEEKHKMYMEYFEDPLTRNKALKIAQNYNTLVTIETRGEGGYILIPPSKGYEKVYGTIQEISTEEYNILLESAREVSESGKIIKKDSRYKQCESEWKVTPFEDYNIQGDVISLFFSHGWTEVKGGGTKNTRLKRPGRSSSSSALFDNDSRVFTCFSSSTEFDTNRGYTPVDIFSLLECNGDIGETFKKLIELGYGVKK